MQQLRHLTETAANRSIELILPPVCRKCRTPLTNDSQLCAGCWRDIDFITAPICAVTGTPLPFGIDDQTISAQAIAAPPHYCRARAVAEYAGTMRNLVHSFKYNDDHTLTELFAGWLCRAGTELLKDTDLIVPVPLNRWRLWHRRFNQAALLGNAVAAKSGQNIDCQSLVRIKRTKSQVGLSERARNLNLQGAFQVNKNRCRNILDKSILLIDDIITTGATVNAAAKCLLAAGATKVEVLCLAKVIINRQIIN